MKRDKERRKSGSTLHLSEMRWADDPKIANRLINARSEGAAEKPSFRNAFRQRRCLIPADGFYEWQKLGKLKQPFFIGQSDDTLPSG